MAASKVYKPNYRYLLPNNNYVKTQITNDSSPTIEFDESDVWSSSASSASSRSQLSPREFRKQSQKKPSHQNAGVSAASTSVPVNVPDWSKILKSEYRNVNCYDNDGDDDVYEDGGEWIPPHEFLARTRVASLSVHEGVGRTLKGRDLSRVRNAIWQKTGFQD